MSWWKRIAEFFIGLFRNKPGEMALPQPGGGLSSPGPGSSSPAGSESPNASGSLRTVPWTVKLRHPQGKWEKTLTTPIKGRFVQEAHYATSAESFNGDLFPVSKSQGISIHLSRSLGEVKRFYPSASIESVYPHATFNRTWTPGEAGGGQGQGSVGNLKPSVEQECWQGNMMWASGQKPKPGTKFLISNPKNGRKCVIQMGFETGPAIGDYVGGVVSEVHYVLSSSNDTSLVLEYLEDQSVPLGPILKTVDRPEDSVDDKPQVSSIPPWVEKALPYKGSVETDPKFSAIMVPLWKKLFKIDLGTIKENWAAWCGLGMGAALMWAGMSWQPDGQLARNWGDYGVEIQYKVNGAPRGAIVWKNRYGNCEETSGNHVTTLNGDCTAEDLTCKGCTWDSFGANENNRWQNSTYGVHEICAIRWPKEYPFPGKVTKSVNCTSGRTSGGSTQ